MSLITPGEARARILAAASPIAEIEHVGLREALGRTLAADLAALRTQPPFAASAMDGYAVRADDLASLSPLALIGEAAAGHPFHGAVGPGQCVRIFTGAPVPPGADTILIQENARRDADRVIPAQAEPRGRFVRPMGLDFKEGDALLASGLMLGPRHVGLAASMGHESLPVRRKPRIALISTGDELVAPGSVLREGEIVSSNAFAIAAMVEQAGGLALDRGVVPDDAAATAAAIAAAAEAADVVVTLGGASVGEHDLVQSSLSALGFELAFWKVALRPGKPLMMARRDRQLCLGLPGNPVSAMVCAILFLKPLILSLLGRPADAGAPWTEPAVLGCDLPANDHREDYMRAVLSRDAAGRLVATPFASQDSSMQSVMARAEALLVRPADAARAKAGDACAVILLDGL